MPGREAAAESTYHCRFRARASAVDQHETAGRRRDLRVRWPEYAGLAALAALFTVLAVRTRWYHDDVFVGLRYAVNLAGGHGFTWNPGGPWVEGTPSLGATLVAALALVAGMDPVLVAWTLGMLSGLAGLGLAWWAARKLVGTQSGHEGRREGGHEGRPYWALLAPAVLAAHRDWLAWCSAADGTGLAALLGLVATLRLVREHAGARRRRPWSGLLFFAATLLRPGAPVLHAGAALGLAAAGGIRGRAAALQSAGVHAALLLVLAAARFALFGSALPHALRAAPLPLDPGDGGRWLGEFLGSTGGWLWAPLLLGGLVAAGRLTPLAATLLAQLGAQVAWAVVLGGDRYGFRALVPVLPAFAVLLVPALLGIRDARGAPTRGRRVVLGVLAVAVGATQAATTFAPREPGAAAGAMERLKEEADGRLSEAHVLAPLVGPGDVLAAADPGVFGYLLRAPLVDPWGAGDPASTEWPVVEGPDGPRHAVRWEDLAARSVEFVDVYGRFLFDTPRPPAPPPVGTVPWARRGVPVYSAQVGGPAACGSGGRFWIFASPAPREQVLSWLAEHRLPLCHEGRLGERERTSLRALP